VHTPINDRGMVTIGIDTALNDPKNRKITKITIIAASTIVLITSIASNLELINFLENNCKKIIKLEFPDHHTYKESDIFKIKLHSQKLKEKNLIGITTAKDSVKLKNLEILKSLEFDIFVIQ
jgi:tetraacyldisaccharide-1-P 4'-kinase